MRMRVLRENLRVEIENEMRVFLESLNFEIEMRVSQKSVIFRQFATRARLRANPCNNSGETEEVN